MFSIIMLCCLHDFEHDYDYGQAGCVWPLIIEEKSVIKIYMKTQNIPTESGVTNNCSVIVCPCWNDNHFNQTTITLVNAVS